MAAGNPNAGQPLPRTPVQAVSNSMQEANQRWANAVVAFNNEIDAKVVSNQDFAEKLRANNNHLQNKVAALKNFGDLSRQEMQEVIETMKLLRAKLGPIEGMELGRQISAAEAAHKEFKILEQQQLAREGAPGVSAIEKIGFNKGRIFVDTTPGKESTFAHWSWDYNKALERFKDMAGVEKYDREMYVTPPLSDAAKGSQGAPGLLGNWPQRSEFNTYFRRVEKCLDADLFPTDSIDALIATGNMSGSQWKALDAKIKAFNEREQVYKRGQTPNLGVGTNQVDNSSINPAAVRGMVLSAAAARGAERAARAEREQAGLNVANTGGGNRSAPATGLTAAERNAVGVPRGRGRGPGGTVK
ncbi:MAG TPA: hypothetical protein VGV92_09270 [Gammaproteobacteria bacterium]|nr:hypothetical protein [Gammaproteobacteria bacterium]